MGKKPDAVGPSVDLSLPAYQFILSHWLEPCSGPGKYRRQSGLTAPGIRDFMGRVFIFTIICLGLTLILSTIVIWNSFEDRSEALYESEILDVKAAQTRENAGVGMAPGVNPESDPDLPVDYTDLTPGLQQLLRDGKLNPEITVDRVR